jgi:hypothetical protein
MITEGLHGFLPGKLNESPRKRVSASLKLIVGSFPMDYFESLVIGP